MDEFRLSFPACLIAGKTGLDAHDLMALRRYAFPDGLRSSHDVVTLLTIHNCCPAKCPEWDDYVVEQVAAFVVDRCHPHGSIDTANASWLIGLLSSQGVVHTVLELEILLHALDKACDAPDMLSTLVLDQLRLALCEGRGAYRHLRGDADPGVTLADLRYIYRILRGSVSRGRMALPASQRDCLMRIDRETPASAQHHPGWGELMTALSPARAMPAKNLERRWLNIADRLLLEPEMAA